MANRLHGSARTTPRIRAELQLATGSHRSLAKLYGINPKTVAKWRARTSVLDEPMGPRDTARQHLSQEQEHLAIALRKQGHLSLDDLMGQLLETAPRRSRSALHRCLQRHGISRLPDVDGDKPKRQRFKRYPIGFFHIDIAEVQTAEGKLYLFVAIDRTSKFAFVRLVQKAGKMAAAQFLRDLIAAVPYRLHKVLTDNGIQFANRSCDTTAFEHIFGRVCREHGIEHRLTKVRHPWTNGQVERMNRTIKEATVKRFHYDNHDQLRTHLDGFIAAYDFARRLKTLNGLTPYEYICKVWTSEPDRFIVNPIHQMPGLNT